MGRLAFVTGATGGLGSAISARLIHEEYDIIALARNPENMAQLAKTLPPGRVHQVLFDVCSPQASWYTRILDIVSEHGEPDLLVVAHGSAPVVAPTVSLEGICFADVLLTDVWGAFMACQSIGSYMVRQKRGSIILLSSLHAHQTYPARACYATSKAAICGLARALAVEWGPSNVRVNTILPWQCEGSRTAKIIEAARREGYDLEEAYRQRCPLRRLVKPEDVADAVLFLARNEAMNGCELVLDGGTSQSMWYQPFCGA